MTKPIMTMVGFGPMGKRFTRLFADEFDVRVCSSRDVDTEVKKLKATVALNRATALASSDYIFLSIPISALGKLVEQINVSSKKKAIVIDCCSARVKAELILSSLRQQHFGMHDIMSGEYCITGDLNEEMKDFFFRHNIPIHIMTPEEHDRINAVIGLGHFVGLSLGKLLSLNEKKILSGIGSGTKVMALVNHLENNSPATWRETQIDNQFTREKRAAFIEALAQYHEALSRGDYPF